jgi:hypothetical protein
LPPGSQRGWPSVRPAGTVPGTGFTGWTGRPIRRRRRRSLRSRSEARLTLGSTPADIVRCIVVDGGTVPHRNLTSPISTFIQLCRLNRSCLRQRDWGIAAPDANALLVPIQGNVAMTIRAKVKSLYGADPESQFFETPIVVGNRSGEIAMDLDCECIQPVIQRGRNR